MWLGFLQDNKFQGNGVNRSLGIIDSISSVPYDHKLQNKIIKKKQDGTVCYSKLFIIDTVFVLNEEKHI